MVSKLLYPLSSMMIGVFMVIVLCSFDIKPAIAATSCSPPTPNSKKTYTAMADKFILLNPERGFYDHVELNTSSYNTASYNPVNPGYLKSLQTNHNGSIIFLFYILDNFVTSDISRPIIDKMTTDFKTLRSAAFKCVLRFAYTKIDGNMNDAALTQLLNHITQLTPILQNNADVILAVQAGFIGTYGEWYYSKNYATGRKDDTGKVTWYSPDDKQQTARNTIVSALLKAVHSSRMIQLRTPSYKQIYCKTTNNLSPQQAFNPSIPCARIGIHNDCFMASGDDSGTFANSSQRTWLTKEGLYTINGGESCIVNNPQTSCEGGKTAIAAQRFSYLNIGHNQDVITGWKKDGCFNTIANMMGYRFQLVDGTFPNSVARGSKYQAAITIKNSGVAPLYNFRPVQVILRNRDKAFPFPQAQIDPRLWAPGTTSAVCLSFTVPSDLAKGSYDVILNLPDSSKLLADQPLARILFANSGGVQETATRYNVLGQVNIG